MKHMPDKLRERVKFYNSVDELEFMEKKNLPKEYGGEMSIDDMLSKRRFAKIFRTRRTAKLSQFEF